jgi:hypothetical protein
MLAAVLASLAWLTWAAVSFFLLCLLYILVGVETIVVSSDEHKEDWYVG